MENIDKAYGLTEEYLQEFLDLPKKAQQLLMLPILKMKLAPRAMFADESIQSPIEKIFITAFELYTELENKKKIYLFEQEKIQIKNKTYYADFMFKADDYLSGLILGDKIKNFDYKLIIECDGHDFHEKTKEQVKHDNEREYDLKMAGYEILRFSGSQIYNEPLKCARDTYNYILKKIEEE